MTCLFLIRIWDKLVIRSLGFPGGSAGKEFACKAGDLGSIPGSGRSPREGNGYPLQYSGQEISMYCIVHGVAKSWTWLSDFHFHPACKLNKQGDDKQPGRTPFPIWNQSVVPCPGLTVASVIVAPYRFRRRQVRWSGIPISWRIFHSVLWSTESKALM